jgi:endonuclease/exonuclease/phosphatase family metal-dependent hydrolase
LDFHVLAGDFNAGPTVSLENYQQILDAGYLDSFLDNDASRRFTWEVTNPLNKSGPHKSSPNQRIDHVFLPSAVASQIQVSQTSILLHEPSVEVSVGQSVTVSDHYALRVEFSIRPRGE